MQESELEPGWAIYMYIYKRTSCDTQTGGEVVGDRERECLDVQGDPICGYQTAERNDKDEGGI